MRRSEGGRACTCDTRSSFLFRVISAASCGTRIRAGARWSGESRAGLERAADISVAGGKLPIRRTFVRLAFALACRRVIRPSACDIRIYVLHMRPIRGGTIDSILPSPPDHSILRRISRFTLRWMKRSASP